MLGGGGAKGVGSRYPIEIGGGSEARRLLALLSRTASKDRSELRVRIDPGTSPDLSPDPSPDRPETARFRGGVGRGGGAGPAHGGDRAGRSLRWSRPWLVPPYLILMALLLSPSSQRPQGEPDSEASEASESSRSAQPAGTSDADDLASEGPDSPEASDDESEQATASKPSRARRGKGKVRKAKPLPEPTEATWIQVAPGKFVRAEAADDPMGLAGPHPPVKTPAEPIPRAATPRIRRGRSSRSPRRPGQRPGVPSRRVRSQVFESDRRARPLRIRRADRGRPTGLRPSRRPGR